MATSKEPTEQEQQAPPHQDGKETTPALRKRSVVSCFIFKLPTDYPNYNGNNNNGNNNSSKSKPKVALFLRSNHPDLHTYQNHVAPISGSIITSSNQNPPSTDNSGDPSQKPNGPRNDEAESEAQSESPLACAYREIREETTLTSSDLILFRRGKPYSFRDERRNVMREWTIHPFAFRLRNPATGEGKVKIDWEHQSWDWYDPGEVLDSLLLGGGGVEDDDGSGGGEDAETFTNRFGYSPVPRLGESLRRVWVENSIGKYLKKRQAAESRDGSPSAPGMTLARALYQLQHDHESGARELAGIALAAFRDILGHLDEDIDEDEQASKLWWTDVRMIAWHLWKNGRESMGSSILNVLLEALQEIEHTISTQSLERKRKIHETLTAQIENRKLKATDISESFIAYIKRNCTNKTNKWRILTLSSSSTIRTTLKHIITTSASDLDLDLRILESRPLYEGVTLASAIWQEVNSIDSTEKPKIKITIYTDSSVALASQDIDFLLLGADRISPDGSVCNKTGSLPAVLSARFVSPRCKVVVLSEREKIATTEEREVEDNDPEEVIKGWENGKGPKGAEVFQEALRREGDDTGTASAQVKNIYFEWVSPDLIDTYVCEDGKRDVQQIRERSDLISGLVEHYFGQL